MAETTHTGAHPAGAGDTQHKGERENCPAPDCMDTAAEQAHAAESAARRAGLRETLRAIHKQLSSAFLELNSLNEAGCGSDCCLGFWPYRHANAFIQDADRAVWAAEALVALEA